MGIDKSTPGADALATEDPNPKLEVLIFGGTGMLGRYIIQVLDDSPLLPIPVRIVDRSDFDISKADWIALRNYIQRIHQRASNKGRELVVINCAAVLASSSGSVSSVTSVLGGGNHDDDWKRNMILVNTIFPLVLGEICGEVGVRKLIHVSTDVAMNIGDWVRSRMVEGRSSIFSAVTEGSKGLKGGGATGDGSGNPVNIVEKLLQDLLSERSNLSDPMTLYALTKSVGEPVTATSFDGWGLGGVKPKPIMDTLIIRTSIIGEEWESTSCSGGGNKNGQRTKNGGGNKSGSKSGKSMLTRLLNHPKHVVYSGFTDRMWNGVTCLEFANWLVPVITGDIVKGRTRIISLESSKRISKYDKVNMINEEYNLGLKIRAFEGGSVWVAPGIKVKIGGSRSVLASSRVERVVIKKSLRGQIREQKLFDDFKKRTKFRKGVYTKRECCRFCGESARRCSNEQFKNFSSVVFHLPEVGLAGGFLPSKKHCLPRRIEPVFPLSFLVCDRCHTGWVQEVVEAEELFQNEKQKGDSRSNDEGEEDEENEKSYFYHSSTLPALAAHFRELAGEIGKAFAVRKVSAPTGAVKALEIGCNDGVLLKPLALQNTAAFQCVGIDPAACVSHIEEFNKQNQNGNNNLNNTNVKNVNPISPISFHRDFFNKHSADTLLDKYGEFDLVMGFNCLAHIDDMGEIFSNVWRILKSPKGSDFVVDETGCCDTGTDGGILLFEVHYALRILEDRNFDFIYHEHMSYYTVRTCLVVCERFGFELLEIREVKNHGGSLRVWMRKKAAKTQAGMGHDGNKLNLSLASSSSSPLDILLVPENQRISFVNSGAGLPNLADRVKKQLILEQGFPRRMHSLFNDVQRWARRFKRVTRAVRSIASGRNSSSLSSSSSRPTSRPTSAGSSPPPLVGYGASGRVNTILALLDGGGFDLLLDDSPAKAGSFTPYYHIPIRCPAESELYKKRKTLFGVSVSSGAPGVGASSVLKYPIVFLMAWPYSESIISKHIDYLKQGGKFIIILPEIVQVWWNSVDGVIERRVWDFNVEHDAKQEQLVDLQVQESQVQIVSARL